MISDSNSENELCVLCERGKHQDQEGQSSCKDCILGKYAASKGESNCFDCMKGQYASGPKHIACKMCIAGQFSSTKGAFGCTECIKGKFSSTIGAFECSECVKGTFTASTMQTSCKKCPKGFAATVASSDKCLECPAGTSSSNEASFECRDCIVGKYAENTGQITCKDCTQGKYLANSPFIACKLCASGFFAHNSGQENCRKCSSGKFASDAGAAECLKCEPGTFSISGKDRCLICPHGFYQDKPAQSSCMNCVKETLPGATECDNGQCSDGQYRDSNNGGVCYPCETGKWSDQREASICKICPIGYYSGPNYQVTLFSTKTQQQETNTFGANLCFACQEGKYGEQDQQELESDACIPCPGGKWTDVAGHGAACSDCPKGTYSSSIGLDIVSKCTLCTPGKYNNEIGSNSESACKLCDAGKYLVENGAIAESQCIECEKGKYQSERGAINCYACIKGRYSAQNGAPACTNCQHGKYSTTDGMESCTLAASHTYVSGWSENYEGGSSVSNLRIGFYSSECSMNDRTSSAKGCMSYVSCPRGWISENPPTGICIACEKGKRAKIEGNLCAGCMQGKFARKSNSTICESCPDGWFQDSIGSAGCKACEAGRYGPGLEEKNCKECSRGFYTDNAGQTYCKQCPSGYVQINQITFCSICDAGKFQQNLECIECNAGFYQKSQGAIQCLACPLGFVQPNPSSYDCKECKKGKFSSSTRLPCFSCNIGQYQNENGKFSCKICEAGLFQNKTEQTNCFDCVAGFFTGIEGSVQCSSCLPGFYTAGISSRVCEPCPRGYIQKLRSSVKCLICGVGKYQHFQNCQLCSTGKYSFEVGVIACVDCPAGYVQEQVGDTSCDACAKGKYIGVRGGFSCKFCDKGKYTNMSKSISCSICPAGFVQPMTGLYYCEKCKLGQESNEEVHTCGDCIEGTYGNKEGLADCYICPEGWIQGDFGKTRCFECLKGKHANKDLKATTCLHCPSGWYNNETEQASCKACPRGWFQKDPRQPICYICNAGKEAKSAKAALTCVDCDAGFFSPENGGYYNNRKMIREDTNHTNRGCRICPYGWHRGEVGQSTCIACPLGKIVDDVLKPVSCVTCLNGRFASKSGSIECKSCPRGYFRTRQKYLNGVTTDQKMDKCDGCPKGMYSTIYGAKDIVSVAATKCQLCPSGYYTENNSTNICKECPHGFYQQERGMPECEICQHGSDTRKQTARKISCDQCEGGQYSKTLYELDKFNNIIQHILNSSLDGSSCSNMNCRRKEANCKAGYLCCKLCDRGFYQPQKGQFKCLPCLAGFFSQEGQQSCVRKAKDVEMLPPRLKSLRPIDRTSNKMSLEFYLKKEDFLGIGLTEETRRNGKNLYDKVGILFQWSSVDSTKNFPDLNARPEWVNMGCGEMIHSTFPGSKKYMDSLYFFCISSESSQVFFKADDDDDIEELRNSVLLNYEKYKLLHAARTNTSVEDIKDDTELIINVTIEQNFPGPVWDHSIYLRAAYMTSTSTSSQWTNKYGGTKTTHDCFNSVSRQEYLRTYPQDNTCLPMLDLLQIAGKPIELNDQQNVGNTIECIRCPAGGNCLTGEKVIKKDGAVTNKLEKPGMYLWRIGKLKDYWRIPWAPMDGERKSRDGNIIQPPQWFHPCFRKGVCLGIDKQDRMIALTNIATKNNTAFIGGWNNSSKNNEAMTWTCPEPFPKPRCKIGNGGPLCAMCTNQWTRIQGKCRKCFTVETRIGLVFFGVAFGIIVLSLINWLVKRCRKFYSSLKDATRILIVGINLAQIMSAANSVIPVQWPPLILWFFEQLDFVNFDVPSITGATCNKDVNFYIQFMAMGMLPVITVVYFFIQHNASNIKLRHHLRKFLKRTKERDEAILSCYGELFDIIDGNGDGHVDSSELLDLLKLVGYQYKRQAKSKNKEDENAVTSELIQVLCNSRFGTRLTRKLFVESMASGSLADQLDKITQKKIATDNSKHANSKNPKNSSNVLHHGIDILVWNERRKLVVSNLSFAMQALMLIHAPVSRKVFQYFDCDQIGVAEWSKSFLRADYSIPCGSGGKPVMSYMLFLPIVMIVFVFFTAALPLMLGGYFHAKKEELYTPAVVIRLGWMYRRMPRGTEFWELFELIRKMTLTGIIVFFPRHPVVRSCFCLIVCFFSSGCLNYFRPHKNKLVFWVEQMGYSIALLVFIAAIMFSDSVKLSARDAEYISFIVIGIFMLFCFFGTLAIAFTICMVQRNINIEMSEKTRLSQIRPSSQPERRRLTATQFLQNMSAKAIEAKSDSLHFVPGVPRADIKSKVTEGS
jgi:hypothetical protein